MRRFNSVSFNSPPTQQLSFVSAIQSHRLVCNHIKGEELTSDMTVTLTGWLSQVIRVNPLHTVTPRFHPEHTHSRGFTSRFGLGPQRKKKTKKNIGGNKSRVKNRTHSSGLLSKATVPSKKSCSKHREGISLLFGIRVLNHKHTCSWKSITIKGL